MTALDAFWPCSSCTDIGVINRGILLFALKATSWAATAFLSHDNLLRTLWELFFLQTLYQTRVSNIVLAFHSCHGIHKSLWKQVSSKIHSASFFLFIDLWASGLAIIYEPISILTFIFTNHQPYREQKKLPLINTVCRQGKKSSKMTLVIPLIKGPVRSVKTFPFEPLGTEQNQHPWVLTQMGFKNLPLEYANSLSLWGLWACHSSSAASSAPLSLSHSLSDTELSCVPKLSKFSPVFPCAAISANTVLLSALHNWGWNKWGILWAFFY